MFLSGIINHFIFSFFTTPVHGPLRAASVSGFYFAHEQSKYSGMGKINKDQVADYARRKGQSISVIEKWLQPNLGY